MTATLVLRERLYLLAEAISDRGGSCGDSHVRSWGGIVTRRLATTQQAKAELL
jgi:hypothetical protein